MAAVSGIFRTPEFPSDILFAALLAHSNSIRASKQMYPPSYPAPFNSAHTRARIVRILLIAGAIAAGLSLVAEVVLLVVPPMTEDQELTDNPVAVVVVLITLMFAVLEAIIYITTVVFFCMWLYRAYDNLRAFGHGRQLEHSPGWAVGSFFVPFVNLVIPYRAVREVWQKSAPPDEALLSAPSPPAWFPIWWAFWLISCFADNISLRASFNEDIAENITTTISIVAGALSIIAALLAYLVVDAIDNRQEETSQKLKLGQFSGPPAPGDLQMWAPVPPSSHNPQ